MLFHPLANRAQATPFGLGGLVERRDVGRGRRGRRPEQDLHHPFPAQDRRGALRFRGEREHAGMPKNAAAPVVGIRHAPHLSAHDPGNAVMPGEPLVDKRVVRREEIGHGAVIAKDLAEERLGFAAHRRLQLLVEIGIEAHIGIDLVEVLQPQPLPGKPRAEHIGPRISEHAGDLRVEVRGAREPARLGQAQQFCVGRRRPQEERQPRRQVEIAEGVGLSGLGRQRSVLETKYEARARQDAFERHADALFEAAVG